MENESTIIMRTFSGLTLQEVDRKFRDWKSFVNDDTYYSIIEQSLITGNKEYLLIIRYKKALTL